MPVKSRPHILMITKWYPNRHDVQIGVFIRKQVLAILDHADVTVFYAQSDEHILRGKMETDVQESPGLKEYQVYYHKNSTVFSPLINSYRYFKAWKETFKKIRKEKGMPDIVHAYILLRPGIIAWWMKIKFGIPYVVSEQWSGYVTGKFENRPSLIKWLTIYIADHASAMTAVSEFLRKKMQACGFRNAMQVISNIIEIQQAPSNKEVEKKTRILIVADLVDDIKNISGVLRSLALVSKEFQSLELRIIGHGKDEMKLKNLAANLGLLNTTVFFEGVKPNEIVYEYLWNCDFLVMNSRFETFSLVCAEALSCGKPVISTRCGGPEEFMNPENGIIIAPGVDEELVEAIKSMIVNYHRYDPEKIRAYALNRFSKVQAGNQFNLIYQKVLQKEA